MTTRDQIMEFLDGLLDPAAFQDACPNGLQVYGRDTVEKIATCASVSEAFFRLAAKEEAHLLLVHHGLFWSGASQVVDPMMGRRLRLLLENEMNLAAYHLPIDAHPELGNNKCLASAMDLADLDFGFGRYKGMAIGCRGNLPVALPLRELADKLADQLGGEPFCLDAGSGEARCVAVVSGGGGDVSLVLEAAQAGCDTLVTGTIFEQTVAVARETGINLVALGHYNSEKLGVQSVGDAVSAKFAIPVVHLDVPNPV
jgi:dinuclear metal center YbgI/SA1388 family protein